MYSAHDLSDGKLWELREDDKKIGFIHITPYGYTVKDDKSKSRYKDLDDLQSKYNKLVFYKPESPKSLGTSIYGYPCDATPFNDIWDVASGLPLYTKMENSRAIFCAGYYVTHELKVLFCPRQTSLQPGKYFGPFKTELEARGF